MSKSYFGKDTPEIVLKSVFMRYDQDGDGSLTPPEAKMFLQGDLGLTAEQTETCILLWDSDGSGELSFNEFTKWMNSGTGLDCINDPSRYFILRKAVQMFKKYDGNFNGTLEREEMKLLMQDMTSSGQVNMDAVMNGLDSDNNDTISFPEFLSWLKWIPTN